MLPHVNGEVPAQRGIGHLDRSKSLNRIKRSPPPALRATSPLRWGGKGTPLCHEGLRRSPGGYAPNRGIKEEPDCYVDPFRVSSQ